MMYFFLAASNTRTAPETKIQLHVRRCEPRKRQTLRAQSRLNMHLSSSLSNSMETDTEVHDAVQSTCNSSEIPRKVISKVNSLKPEKMTDKREPPSIKIGKLSANQGP